MERKLHHCALSGLGPSMKERFRTKSGKVRTFLSGQIPIADDAKNAKLQREIFEFVQKNNMTPRTRTVYDRMSFQLPYSNDIRISLDMNLTFIKEKIDMSSNGLWFTPSDDVNDDDVSEFPLDILEIKLVGDYADNPPEWIADLMDSSLLIESYKVYALLRGSE